MALLKNITANNGIITKYHRISTITTIINDCHIIEVASYTSEEKRNEEKQALENKAPMDVYIDTHRFKMPYSESITIDAAYDYIKNLDVFERAKSDI